MMIIPLLPLAIYGEGTGGEVKFILHSSLAIAKLEDSVALGGYASVVAQKLFASCTGWRYVLVGTERAVP